MFYLLTVFAVLLSTVSAQDPSGDSIPTNGTEMRNLTNSTLWGRYDYWNNLTNVKLRKGYETTFNSSIQQWLKQHNMSAGQIHQNQTLYSEFEDHTTDSYIYLVATWLANYRTECKPMPPSILESEIAYFVSKVGDQMDRAFIQGYLGAAAYTYDRAAYTVFRPQFDASISGWNEFVLSVMNDTFDRKLPSNEWPNIEDFIASFSPVFVEEEPQEKQYPKFIE